MTASSSHGVLSPFSASGTRASTPSPARASSGHGLTSTAAFRLRRFDDLDGLRCSRPPPGLPGEHSWAFVLQGSSRAAGGATISGDAYPLGVSPHDSRSLRGLSPCRATAPPGAYSSGPTVTARFRFPFLGGSRPSWTFFWDLAPRTAAPVNRCFGKRPYGPTTFLTVKERQPSKRKVRGAIRV